MCNDMSNDVQQYVLYLDFFNTYCCIPLDLSLYIIYLDFFKHCWIYHYTWLHIDLSFCL